MNANNENADLHDFGYYYLGILQLIHDTSNVVQKMMSISFQEELNGKDMRKIDQQLEYTSQMLKIYTGIYGNSHYKFDEIIEMIQILYNKSIELNVYDITDLDLARVVLVYCMWICKNYDVDLIIDENSVTINIHGQDEDKLEFYSLDSDSSLYVQILQSILTKSGRIVVSKQGAKITISI